MTAYMSASRWSRVLLAAAMVAAPALAGAQSTTPGAKIALQDAIDILPDPRIRQELSGISGWPTIPQVFVKGELIGGADITEELHASGELRHKLDEALGSEREQTVKTVALDLELFRHALTLDGCCHDLVCSDA